MFSAFWCSIAILLRTLSPRENSGFSTYLRQVNTAHKMINGARGLQEYILDL
jgi:hypothetical protein